MRHRAVAIAIAIACSFLALAGCSGETHSDLRQFVKDSDKLPRGRIPPLPEVKPYDPFVPRKIEPPKGVAVAGGVKPPDPDRRKEPLEAYPLENLRMVGTLEQKNQFHALIKTPDNNLFRVSFGNFMGQNFGRITDINESEIKLKELVQDSGGAWKEEERTMLLQE